MKAVHSAIAILILSIFLLPAFAQRGGGPPPPPAEQGKDARQFVGRVVSVDAKSATVAVFVKVDNPDAPGKVPDQMATRAAELEDLATKLERKGKTVEAERTRNLAREMRCWREVETKIDGSVPLLRVTREPLTGIAVGTRLFVDANADAAWTEDTLPATVRLIGDARQTGPNEKIGVRPGGRGPGPREQANFIRFVGEVASVSPLVVKVNDQRITVENPRSYQYLHVTPMTLKDLHVNAHLFMRAQLREKTTVDRILSVLVSDLDPPAGLGFGLRE